MVGIVARKYARALFELAAQANEINRYMAAASDVLPLFDEATEFFEAVSSPSIFGEDKVSLFIKAAQNAPDDFAALFALLIRKGRVGDTKDVFEGFIELAKEHNRITTARVYSAKPIDEARLSEIKAKLEGKLLKTVEIDAVIDESLIAGVKISVDGHEIDGTVRRGIDSMVKLAISN